MTDGTRKEYRHVIQAKNYQAACKHANWLFDLRFCTVEVVEGNFWRPIV